METIEKDLAFNDYGPESITDTAAHTNGGAGYSGFQVIGGDAVITEVKTYGGVVVSAYTGQTVKDGAVYVLPITSITRASGGNLVAFKKRP